MTTELLVIIIVDAVLLLGLIIFLSIRTAREKRVVEEKPIEITEINHLTITVNEKEEKTAEPILEDPEDDRFIKKPLTFAEKVIALDQKSKSYYNEIDDKFRSMRKVGIRVSKKCLTIRFNKEVLAKVTVHGKTLRLNLALNFNDFDQKIYFQKDVSNVKAYIEVPFAVKVKSDRGLKNALKLIEFLAKEKGVEYKTRHQKIDAVKELEENLLP